MTTENTPNKVYKLASATKNKGNVLQQSDARKAEFQSLQNSMSSNAPKMGRKIILSQEMYNSNILKGDQESKKERF